MDWYADKDKSGKGCSSKDRHSIPEDMAVRPCSTGQATVHSRVLNNQVRSAHRKDQYILKDN